MKRCIICGNVDDDNSTVCSMCGNPYVDMSRPGPESEKTTDPAAESSEATEPEETVKEQSEAEAPQESAPKQPEAEVSQESAAEQPEAEVPQESAAEQPEAEVPQESVAEQPEATVPGQVGRPAAGNRPRRPRGGPQIYGQEELMAANPELYANQGALRRDVPPRSGSMQDGMGYPMNPASAGGAGRPVNRMPAGTGRPMGQMPGGPGRPSGQDFLSKRVMEIARKALRSPLFLLIALLNTAHVAASIAAIFLGELNYSQVVRLLNESNLPRQASGYVNTVTAFLQKLDSSADLGMIITNIALHIPAILFCLGLWLIFITAMAARERMSGVGFGFAKAAIIIRMIVAGLAMLAVLVAMVTLVIAAWASGDKTIVIMTVIMLVLSIVIIMMIIMYYFSYIGTLKTCRLNADTGESYGKPSKYLAVLLIILALPGIVGLLSGIVNMEISNIVGSVAEMAWMILFAVWIFLYRGKMGELEE